MNEQKVREFISVSHEQIEGWFFPLDQLVFYELIAIQDSLNIGGDFAEVAASAHRQCSRRDERGPALGEPLLRALRVDHLHLHARWGRAT